MANVREQLYTREVLDRAIALKATGMNWRAVAARLGRLQNSLEVAVCRYRKGYHTTFAYVESAKLNDKLAEAVEAGEPNAAVLGRRFGLSTVAAGNRLRQMGLDREMRDVAAREFASC